MSTAIGNQIKDLADTIALQADALASGKVDADALFTHVRRIADNAETLKAWTAHTTPQSCNYCGWLPQDGHSGNCGRPASHGELAQLRACQHSPDGHHLTVPALDGDNERMGYQICGYCGSVM